MPVPTPILDISRDYGATYTHLTVVPATGAGGTPRASLGGASGALVDPTTGDVYANGAGGLAKSSDGGNTWTTLSAGGTPVEFDWTNGTIFFNNYKSTDHGATRSVYTDTNKGLGVGRHMYVLSDPNASGHFFRHIGDNSELGLDISRDDGVTWTDANLSQLCIASSNGKCSMWGPYSYISDVAFSWPQIPQRSALPPLAGQPASVPATAPAPQAAPQPTANQGLHFVTTSDGQFYFIQSTLGWLVVPDGISDDDLGALTIGDTWHYIPNDQVQPVEYRVVRGGDGRIYLVQGSQGWILAADSLVAEDLAAITVRGQIYGGIPAGWLLNPTAVLLPPPPEAVAPVPAANSGDVPDTLTDDVRQALTDAIHRANNAWAQAKATGSDAPLDGNVAGAELQSDQSEVAQELANHRLEKDTQVAFSVSDMSLDAPGHATVHTTESWSRQITSSGGQPLGGVATANYAETYTIEFQNGGWIVTLDHIDSHS
jgi:hypothetical protein